MVAHDLEEPAPEQRPPRAMGNPINSSIVNAA